MSVAHLSCKNETLDPLQCSSDLQVKERRAQDGGRLAGVGVGVPATNTRPYTGENEVISLLLSTAGASKQVPPGVVGPPLKIRDTS